MAERTSNVYDILHPSPVSLKELSVIAVGLEVWRCEINEYRKNGTLDSFRATCSDMTSLLRTKLPELPSVIYNVIVEYVTRLGKSIAEWLEEYLRTVRYFDNSNNRCTGGLSKVLEHFDDFVCDYNGTIDFIRTAERMMRYDYFDDVSKFVVACKHFLEDHVRRIWPSVRQNIDLSSIDLYTHPQLYYWICHLSNQSNEITGEFNSVDKNMLIECIHMSGNSLAMNYFWNRIPYANQNRMAVVVYERSMKCFVRCILAKLDDRQLVKFVNAKGSYLMRALVEDQFCDERFILQAWMYINNTMNGNTFSKLVVNMVRTEAGYFMRIDHQKLENWLVRCCLIWNSAPHNLKRSAITRISTKELIICREGFRSSPCSTSSEFLLSILSHFTLEEKQSFWRNCWKNLLINKNVRDLQRIMEACFEREDDMVKLKENVIAASENLQLRCVWLLSRAHFDELDALANFCCPHNAETAKHLKRRTLLSSLTSDDFHFNYKLVIHCEEFDTFINNACDSVDHATDFKHQLISSPRNLTLREVSISIRNPQVSYEAFIKFVETFVSTEQILQLVKFSVLYELATHRNYRIIEEANSKPFLDQFLLWCLGSNERVVEFKAHYIDTHVGTSANELLQSVVQFFPLLSRSRITS
ncbi:uncharacterized protein LOC135847730 isoform X2 [Planococcus citri]|uniref:uncharacterized protein LOC135847730 isoform X2 n=1 Tax=Planococcus citri TaxID=170843 RepID=UPI0031F773D9